MSSTTSAEVGSTLGLQSTSATPSAGFSSRLSSARSTGQEVVRRAVVQGNFRGLRVGDDDLRLSVEDQPARTRPKPAKTAAELARHIATLEKQRRAVRADDLDRGDVLEVRIDLEAEEIYEITAAVTSIVDLVKGREDVFGIASADVAQVEVLSELLRRLLVDLVPVAAKVTSHRHVVLDGRPWLVDATMIAPSSALASESATVTLAGVTELPLYWKDVRRVLFDGSGYTAYVRLAKPGLRTSWSPVKLANVLEPFIADIGTQMRELPTLFRAVRHVGEHREALSVSDTLRDAALVPFGRQLAALTGRAIDDAALADVASRAALGVTCPEDFDDVGVLRSAFEHVVELVQGGDPVDREIVRQLRETHQSVARLRVALDVGMQPPLPPPDDAPGLFLEVEFVAIYW